MSHKSNKQNKQSSRQYDSDVSTINSSYDPLIAQQKQTNLATEAGTNVEGLVSGRTRYASAIQGGILTGVVKEGLRSVAEIVNRKNAAIQVAATARDDRDAKALEAAMKEKKDLAKAIKDEAIRLENLAFTTAKEKREQSTFDADNLAPGVAALMKGNDEEDMATLQEIADAQGVDFNLLYSKVRGYKDKQTNDRLSRLSNDVRDFEYAKETGAIPSGWTIKDYRVWDANIKQSASGEKLSVEAQQAVDVYGDMIIEEMGLGSSAAEAVRIVDQTIASTSGTKLNGNEKSALLNFGNLSQRASKNSGVTDGEESPLPFEPGSALSYADRVTRNKVIKKQRTKEQEKFNYLMGQNQEIYAPQSRRIR